MMIVMLLLGIVQSEAPAYAADAALKGTVYVNEAVVPADGTSQTHVVLLLKDQFDRDAAISPERITFKTTLGHMDGSVAFSVYGQYTSVLTAPVTAGVALISAEVDGVAVPDIARVSFQAGAPSAAHSVVTANTTSLPADGVSQTAISLLLKDRYGNDVTEQASSLQIFTTLGSVGSVAFETYGRYEARIVSVVYGSVGRISGNPGPVVGPLEIQLNQGAIPAAVPNGSSIPAALSVTYETYGAYKAILTAPTTPGTAQITASLNGVTVPSSVYVTFTESGASTKWTGLQFGESSYPVTAGQMIATSLQAVDSNGLASNVTPYADYRIANSSIATIDSGGIVKAIGKGQTVAIATYGGLTAETAIVVSDNNQGNVYVPGYAGSSSHQPAPALNPVSAGFAIQVVSEDGQAGEPIVISPDELSKGVVYLKISTAGGQIYITAANWKQLAAINPQAMLHIRAGSAAILLPVSEIDSSVFSQKYGLRDEAIVFKVSIREPDRPTYQAMEQSAKSIQAELLASPLEFEIQVTGEDGSSTFIQAFQQYVTRTLPLNADSVPETATGVWWSPATGQFQYVPTTFEQENGRWLAVMKRQGASIYTVINRFETFADIRGHWSSNDVEKMASKLIVQGKSKDAFEPDAAITRAETAALLVRSLGLAETGDKSPFADANGGWYETAVGAAYRAGLISGYDDGTFRPMQNITREEWAAMIVRAMNYTSVKQTGAPAAYSPFTDEPAISRWALDDVRIAGQLGIVEGGGSFRPASLTTRAEAVTMLKRMLQLIRFIP
ncbi:S-layer homology domain-containing protein [Paenibacillus thalictri]|nr:invasin domain 3-containing protein [Paenibacillus thalictri]